MSEQQAPIGFTGGQEVIADDTIESVAAFEIEGMDCIRDDDADDAVDLYFREGDDLQDNLEIQLMREYWWISENWKEKGLPKQKFILKTSYGSVEIYNWGVDLTEAQKTQILESFRILLAKTNFDLEWVKYLLISDEDRAHPYGEKYQLIRGECNSVWRSITLYPCAINESVYREGQIGDIPPINGIITHEVGHDLAWKKSEDELVCNLWNDEFADYVDKEGFKVKDPDHVVSSYGKVDSAEDLSETLVAALYNPELLESVSLERKRFMQDHVILPVERQLVAALEEVNPSLPKLPKILKYRVKDLSKGIIIK